MEPINPITQLFILGVAGSVAVLPVSFVLGIMYLNRRNDRKRNKNLHQINFPAQAEIYYGYPYIDIELGDERSHRRE